MSRRDPDDLYPCTRDRLERGGGRARGRGKVPLTIALTQTHPWDRREEAVCGTDAGYFRHIRGRRKRPKTPPCDACRAAHNEAEAARKRRKRAAA